MGNRLEKEQAEKRSEQNATIKNESVPNGEVNEKPKKETMELHRDLSVPRRGLGKILNNC